MQPSTPTMSHIETAAKPVKPMVKPMTGFDSPATKMMVALMQTGKHIYEGTVDRKVKNQRRKRNMAARRARAKARAAAR